MSTQPEASGAEEPGTTAQPFLASGFNLPTYLLPYLRLVRAPAVFSALGDPLAGMLIARGRLPAGPAARVMGAAAALYLAGMALNDYADREEDTRERADRPIPSGAVSPEAAAAIGGGLLLTGVLSGPTASATRVAGAVLAYNFKLKSTPWGPVSMGICRTMSMLMGAGIADGARGQRRAAWAASLLGGYVAGLTLLARGETEEEGNKMALPGVLLAGGVLAGILVRGGKRSLPWVAAAAVLAGPAALRAIRSPSPATTGKAVGAMIRAIPAVDAALAAPRSPLRAAVVAVPLLALVRWGRSLIPIS